MSLTREAASFAALAPLGPVEVPDVNMEPADATPSIIGASLVSPSAIAVSFSRVPALAKIDQPLEFGTVCIGPRPGARAAASLARRISSHAVISCISEEGGHSHAYLSVRPSDDGWIARALIRPSAWAGAASVSIVSLGLAGQPLPCDYLPATIRVGYNHDPAPAGAVLTAAMTGHVNALQAALDAGGSTEEADKVRVTRCML